MKGRVESGLLQFLKKVDLHSRVARQRCPVAESVALGVSTAVGRLSNRCNGDRMREDSQPRSPMSTAITEHYRCPDNFADFPLTGNLSDDTGYFRFGKDTICYGQTAAGFRANRVGAVLYDALDGVTTRGSSVFLPFSPTDVVDNLRFERYARDFRLSALTYGSDH